MKLFGVVFFSGIGILCVVWMVIVLGRGEYLTAVVVLGFAVFSTGLVAIAIWRTRGNLTPRGTFDASGTTIHPDRILDMFTQVWLLASVIAMSLFAVFAPLSKLDIPVGREQRFSLPFIGAAGAVTGVLTLWGAVRRGAMKYLRLTPDGFDFEQGMSSAHRSWDDVQDVTDRIPTARRVVSSAIVMVMSDGQAPTLAAATFTPDGRALRELVRFYWLHPEHRGELTDGRAVERLNRQHFE